MEFLFTRIERLFLTPPSWADPVATGVMALLGGFLLFLILWGLPVVILIAVIVGGNHLTMASYRRHGFPLARPKRIPAQQPFTTTQQARYDDLRAKGWSESASRQAAERLHA